MEEREADEAAVGKEEEAEEEEELEEADRVKVWKEAGARWS